MAIVNATPDSFSDGGHRANTDDAIAAGLRMAADGADIIDVGGESTRPGAAPVSPEREQDRVLPIIAALAAAGLRVSVDTRNAATMRAALGAGASIVNDVSALAHDPSAAGVVAEAGCPVVLMHMRGQPTTMHAEAVYADVVAEVRAELLTRIEAAIRAGIHPAQIAIDPGVGFAKRAPHSLAVLQGLPDLGRLGYPIVVGVSRKSFIATLAGQSVAGQSVAGQFVAGQPKPDQRLGGSLAAGLYAVLRGASILRVHDVRETVQAVRIWRTLFASGTVPLPQRPPFN